MAVPPPHQTNEKERSVYIQMIHWGMTALNHGSSLAVFKDYKLVSWEVSREDNLPSELRRHALGFGSPDRIYWYEQPWLKKARQIYAGQYKSAFDLSVLPSSYLKKEQLSFAPVTYTPHHDRTADAGYYTSPFNHCAIVVIDAIGEFDCVTIWQGLHGELTKVWSRKYPNSLGLMYSAFTKLVGLEPIKQEGLFSEMAQQGDPERYYYDVKEYMGTLVNAHKNMHRGINDWPHAITNLQDQCDIAAAVQEVFTEQVDGVMRVAKDLINSDCLVYMGGCAFNSQANSVIEPKFKYVWTLPNPGDASSSIGAVLYHTKHRVWDYKWEQPKFIDIKV